MDKYEVLGKVVKKLNGARVVDFDTKLPPFDKSVLLVMEDGTVTTGMVNSSNEIIVNNLTDIPMNTLDNYSIIGWIDMLGNVCDTTKTS